MNEIAKRLVALRGDFEQVYAKLKIAEKNLAVEQLEKEVAEPDIWKDVEVATAKNQELAKLKEEVEPWELLKTQIEDLGELMEISGEDLKEELNGQIVAMEAQFIRWK